MNLTCSKVTNLAVKLSLFLTFIVVASFPAPAQEASARIFGTVYDPQGAVIPGVRITVTNTATQVERHATSDHEGSFQVLELPIGNYKVRAERDGFRSVNSSEQKLLINQALRIDVKMEVGATSQTVDVGAEAAAVETVNSTLGQSVTGRTLTDMPLNGRDMLDLAMLQPGVTESNDDNNGAGNYSIAGGRTDSVTFLLDGGLNNDLLDNSNFLDPNPDAVAEFRLLTSDYTAEYGRNGGGVISIVTKSGTNQWHGSLFEFVRNRDFDANDYFSVEQGIPRLDLKRNQYGATFGGPILKDKMFFFLAYQGQRQEEALPIVEAPIFTTANLQGDFSNSLVPGGTPDPGVAAFLQANPYFVPTGGNPNNSIIDPTKFDQIAKNYINAGLIPANASGLLNTTVEPRDNRDELTSKFDFNLSARDKVALTVGINRRGDLYAGSYDPYPYATVPGYPARNEGNYYFTNIGYTRVFSTTLLNDFHSIYHRSNFIYNAPGANLPTGPSLGVQITPDVATGPTNLFFQTGLQLGPSENGPTRYVENTFSWTDAVTWTRGRHNWKFGAGFSPYQENLSYAYYTNGEFDFDSYTGGSSSTGSPYADFLLGIPDAYYQGALAPTNIRSKSTYAFGQDEWHVNKKVVLTLGLRYEYNTPKTDTEGRTYSVIPGLQSTRFVNAPPDMVFPGDPGAPTGVNFPDKKNFAPRIGFALDPTGSGKTSLRGGFGIFYDILKGEDNLQFNGQAPFVSNAGFYYNGVNAPAQGPFNFLSQPFQSANEPNTFPSHPPAANYDFTPVLPINSTGFVYLVDPHLRTPYVYQYNLSLQHNLFADTVVETNYVGSSGHGLTSLKDINPMVLGTTNRLLNLAPGNATCGATIGVICYTDLPEFGNVSNTNYNALEASLTRQPKNSIIGTAYFTFAYTYSHSLDNASGYRQRNTIVPYYSPDLYYSSSDSDVRQRISFSGGWDLPFDRMWDTGPKRLTKGWSLYPIFTWRTGFPYDISAGLYNTNDPLNPGTSGAGDAFMTNAAVVAPIRTFDPRKKTTIYPKIYGTDFTGFKCVITYGPPITGNFIFDPNSFSNVPLENNAYYEGQSGTGPNRCFPQLDPVNNPADRTYGLPRNTLRGPGLVNLNLALAKTTSITERVKLEFRVEYFNALNHPEFAQPTLINNATNITSPIFGQVTTTGSFRGPGNRIGQLAARLTF